MSLGIFSLYSLLSSHDCYSYRICDCYKHKGGIQDLEKARIWLHKAKDSYKYLALCTPKLSVSEYRELAPKVNEENFSDLSVEQLGIPQNGSNFDNELGQWVYFQRMYWHYWQVFGVVNCGWEVFGLLIESEKEGS